MYKKRAQLKTIVKWEFLITLLAIQFVHCLTNLDFDFDTIFGKPAENYFRRMKIHFHIAMFLSLSLI